MYAQDDLTQEIEFLEKSFSTTDKLDAFGFTEVILFNCYLDKYKYDHLWNNKFKDDIHAAVAQLD